MNVRVSCDVCQGKFEAPRPILGKLVRCPYCGEMVSTRTASEASSEPAPRRPVEESTPWSPLSDVDDGNVIPWFVWLGAFAPVAMLGLVSFEPIAIAVAATLVALSLLIATRRFWSKLSRVTGIASLTLLGLGLSTAVSLYAQGSFAKIPFHRLISSPSAAPVVALADAEWGSVTSSELNVGILFPGKTVKTDLAEPNGVDIAVFESKFPSQGTTFALHAFKIPNTQFNESGEMAALQRMHSIVRWVFSEGEADETRRVFYFTHPGLEYQFSVAGKKTTIVCRAFLVRDQAYLVSVTAEEYAPIRPFAEKFLSSFRLLQQPPALRDTRPPELDWKSMVRPGIPLTRPASAYRGHFQPPITLLAFSADGKSLVTGANREHLVLWDIASGHGTTVANTEGYPFFAVDPDGKRLAAPIQDPQTGSTEIRFIELREKIPPLGPANTDLICFGSDSKTAYVALGSQATAWDIDKGEMLWRRTAAKTSIGCQALSPDGRYLVTSAVNDLNVCLWHTTKSGADLATWQAADQSGKLPIQIQQIVFAPDGKSLATASVDQKVRIWRLSDATQPKLVAIILHEAPVTCADYSNSGALLATGDIAGVVRVWEVATGKLVSEFRASEDNQQVRLLRFSPDDSKLAAAIEMGQLRSGVNLYDVNRLPPEAGSQSIVFMITDEPPLLNEK